jgi:hypothetical protein
MACEHARRPRIPPTCEMSISEAFLTRPGALIIRAVVRLSGVLIACQRNKDNLQAGQPSSCDRVPTAWYGSLQIPSGRGPTYKGLVAGLTNDSIQKCDLLQCLCQKSGYRRRDE